MSYGMSCSNNNGELTLSSDGVLFGYIGKASWVSTTQPTATLAGYSTYTIDWPGSILPAAAIATNLGGALILGYSRSGSTWTIDVYHSSGSTNAQGLWLQSATTVYVWGMPVSVSGYGAALYNASGALSADLTRQPLFFKSRYEFAAYSTDLAMTGVSTPAVIGTSLCIKRTTVKIGSTWTNRVFRGAWMWDTTNNLLTRALPQTEYYPGEDAAGINSITQPATQALLIEGSTLP